MAAKAAFRQEATMGRDGRSVVEKVSVVLEQFVDRRTTSLSFNEVLSGTPLSRATAHRVLADMAERGLLAQDAQRDEYRLRPLLLSVAAIAPPPTRATDGGVPKKELLRD